MKTATGSRVDKGEAILAAALIVFGRDGFTDGTVDEIARNAGVAKPTVYNRFGDKQALFTAAVKHGSQQANDRVLEVIASLDLTPTDLRKELERLGRALVDCVSHAHGAALMRLQFAERTRFPELLDGIRDSNRARTIDALAGKLAQLSTSGYLRLRDAPRAARQFMSLVTDDALSASGFGGRTLAESELDQPVKDGVDTFLAAFGPRESDLGSR
ncbi:MULTISPECIES: TetR/AcrR family transcriptional regulator [unclassified Microbacterium]|uniref:TetR/AcrR family transcriptional regulator n=1 Tax=unclassified Microbacterium TaxID=2609290 RepID=UPI00160530AF|nr:MULTISPECIES: TetR/AcrR family transcriptional regulator [unclassified Microbacterium]QNA93574.1 TetR/AcrR family transcriptional regulator [Microbacterium sp. Se63.02b]QYM63831.1 TetR/AcrR family transcriptional regulator [Microbacterium sp. Se5.02b]